MNPQSGPDDERLEAIYERLDEIDPNTFEVRFEGFGCGVGVGVRVRGLGLAEVVSLNLLWGYASRAAWTKVLGVGVRGRERLRWAPTRSWWRLWSGVGVSVTETVEQALAGVGGRSKPGALTVTKLEVSHGVGLAS